MWLVWLIETCFQASGMFFVSMLCPVTCLKYRRIGSNYGFWFFSFVSGILGRTFMTVRIILEGMQFFQVDRDRLQDQCLHIKNSQDAQEEEP